MGLEGKEPVESEGVDEDQKKSVARRLMVWALDSGFRIASRALNRDKDKDKIYKKIGAKRMKKWEKNNTDE